MKNQYPFRSAKFQAALLSVMTMALTAAVLPADGAIRQCRPLEWSDSASLASSWQLCGADEPRDGSQSKFSNDSKVVRIESGQYLICIDGRDQSFITTPLLVVHSTNARLLVQVSESLCQVTVLDGSAVVKNVLERHIVELHRGTVYASELRASDVTVSFASVAEPSNWMPLFQTVKCRTMLSTVSAKALQAGPLAQMLSQQDLSPTSRKALCKTRIVAPPTVLTYEIGDQVAKLMPLSPVLRQHFAPSGLVSAFSSQLVAQHEPHLDYGYRQ